MLDGISDEAFDYEHVQVKKQIFLLKAHGTDVQIEILLWFKPIFGLEYGCFLQLYLESRPL